jgi:putrescine aminotransferase
LTPAEKAKAKVFPPMNSSAALQDLDLAHHLHPFTDQASMAAEGGSQIIVSGEGCYVTDQNGRRLLDGLGGLWCVNVGYGCQEIVDAVSAQMARLPYYCSFFNSTTEPAIRLAARLAELTPPGLGHVMFSNSGSEANETALKMIRAYQKLRGKSGKVKVLSRTFSYHGVTLATTSLTGLPNCCTPFDLPLAGFVQVPAPYAYGAGREADPAAHVRECLAETRTIIEREGAETISAMFVEPVQGAGGVLVPPAGYLSALRAMCREYEILFVADEVITGFGRLGAWFASELWNLEPDLMTLAKGLTSGYLPLGATVVSDEIAAVLGSGGYFAHGFTYSGHPTTAAAALANLDVIERDHLVERVRDDVGPYFQAKLRGLAGHPAVGEARGYGLIGALDVVPREGRASLTPTTLLGLKAAAAVRAEGAIVRGIRNAIAMSPPLIITRAEIDTLLGSVERGLDRLLA